MTALITHKLVFAYPSKLMSIRVQRGRENPSEEEDEEHEEVAHTLAQVQNGK